MFFLRRKRVYRRVVDISWKVHIPEALKLVNHIISTIPLSHQFEYKSIKIRNQKSRWGSCSSRKSLNFNYKIINLPYELAEYLVIHEICHLKEMNHSKNYWELVSQLCPNYKVLSKQLHSFARIS